LDPSVDMKYSHAFQFYRAHDFMHKFLTILQQLVQYYQQEYK